MCVFTWATPDSVMVDRSWLYSKGKTPDEAVAPLWPQQITCNAMALFIPVLQRYSNDDNPGPFPFQSRKENENNLISHQKEFNFLLNPLWGIGDGALPEPRVRIAYICIRARDGPRVSHPAGQLHQQRRFLMKPFRPWNNSWSNCLIKQLGKVHQGVYLKKNPVNLFVSSKVLWQSSDLSSDPFIQPCSRGWASYILFSRNQGH